MEKHIAAIIVMIFMANNIFSKSNNAEQFLQQLDSVIAKTEIYKKEKEEKISNLRKRYSEHLKPEERLWLNKMLYDEFYVYNADSAMNYVESNIIISRQLKREDLEQEWLLNKVFLLSATGLLVEAEKNIQQINPEKLNKDLKFKYYDKKIYLYSHLGQYIGGNQKMADDYYKSEAELKLQAKNYITPDHPSYYCFYGSLHNQYPRSEEGERIKIELKTIVDNSKLSTRNDAINSYTLAIMYNNEGDELNYIKYLAYSAIADIKICNKDIASLEELANIMYNHNEIDRGYTYINYCLNAALTYPNRVRVVNISAIMDKLHKAYQERDIIQKEQLRTYLYIVSILSGILFIAVLLICLQFIKMLKSRKKLDKSNKLLNIHVKELSNAQNMLATMNKELSTVNEKLKISNSQLLESNYVKEEYIGYVFSICSNYISKLEEFRKNISRKLKTGQIEDIAKITSTTTLAQSELKEFYNSFDAVFLHVYPNFVEDFNSLLRIEERVVLKEGELLNTELRIYALVRLGINDSVKIAEFLHCSPQTVYNNRLKTRNKAIIPKEEFAERVRSLGKIQL